jgi:hypothetical protein
VYVGPRSTSDVDRIARTFVDLLFEFFGFGNQPRVRYQCLFFERGAKLDIREIMISEHRENQRVGAESLSPNTVIGKYQNDSFLDNLIKPIHEVARSMRFLCDDAVSTLDIRFSNRARVIPCLLALRY